MLTLETIYSQLDEALNINNVDTVFARDYYIDLVNQQRSLWLRNEYNKNRQIDQNVVQSLGCVEVEKVSVLDCPQISFPNVCTILKTKCEIPNTIEFYHSKAITRVGPLDMTKKSFNFVDYMQIPYKGNGRTNSEAIFAFLFNKHIYLFSKSEKIKRLQYINIRGIFEDPTALSKFNECSGTNAGNPCFTETSTYPINAWMWEYMRPEIIKQLVLKQSLPLDDSNNTKDDKTELPSKTK